MRDPLAPMTLRQPAPQQPAGPEGDSVVDLADNLQLDPSKELLRTEFEDGSVSIYLGALRKLPSEDSSEHAANLAEHLDTFELSRVADELLRLIADDEQRQAPRLEDITKGIELLGIKLEEPRAEPTEEGLSVIRHPIILEAVMRFQANARNELLPADGPVKVRDDGGGTQAEDDEANRLAKDFNHYLTSVAVEYYPDMDRMLFSLGFGGEAYKKVYHDPIKTRPVSRPIDRKNLIRSDPTVPLEDDPRVTHWTPLPPSTVKRMMMTGAWRDVELANASLGDLSTVDRKLSEVAGVQPKTSLDPLNRDRTIYECYCELDLPGYEHKEGLALPYRVTLDKDSRQVLEIRRWWREDDELCIRREVFVEYVFVPAFPGVNIGLLQILGNAGRALTAAWRIALDSGMLANFPGFLMARPSGRQQTSNVRVAPGQAQQIDVADGDISKAIMPLPYRDVTSGFLGIVQDVTQTAQRVGGTAETESGEGRADAPVGTTLALIDQATKVLSAVHKRMHAAQAKEFQLLKDLFRECPEALWRQNNKPNLPRDAAIVTAALDNCDLVPAADPNTASQMIRLQKAVAIGTLAMQSPQLFDGMAVNKRILKMAGIDDLDSLFTKVPPQAPATDPAKMVSAQAQQIAAQAKLADVQTKAETAKVDAQTNQQKVHTDAIKTVADSQNRAQDRDQQLQVEQLRLQREQIIHGGDLAHEQQVHADTMALDHAHHQNELALDHAKHMDNLGLEHARMQQDGAISREQAAQKAQQAAKPPKVKKP